MVEIYSLSRFVTEASTILISSLPPRASIKAAFSQPVCYTVVSERPIESGSTALHPGLRTQLRIGDAWIDSCKFDDTSSIAIRKYSRPT